VQCMTENGDPLWVRGMIVSIVFIVQWPFFLHDQHGLHDGLGIWRIICRTVRQSWYPVPGYGWEGSIKRR